MRIALYTQIWVLCISKYLWLVVKQKYKSKDISELPWDLYSSSHLQSAGLKCLWQGGRHLSILTTTGRPWKVASALFFILTCVFSYINTWPCLCFMERVLPDSLLEYKYLFCLQMMGLSVWRMKKTINALSGTLTDYEDKSVIHFELLKDTCGLGGFSMATCCSFLSCCYPFFEKLWGLKYYCLKFFRNAESCPSAPPENSDWRE